MNKKISSIILLFGLVSFSEASGPLGNIVKKGINANKKLGEVKKVSDKNQK